VEEKADPPPEAEAQKDEAAQQISSGGMGKKEHWGVKVF